MFVDHGPGYCSAAVCCLPFPVHWISVPFDSRTATVRCSKADGLWLLFPLGVRFCYDTSRYVLLFSASRAHLIRAPPALGCWHTTMHECLQVYTQRLCIKLVWPTWIGCMVPLKCCSLSQTCSSVRDTLLCILLQSPLVS